MLHKYGLTSGKLLRVKAGVSKLIAIYFEISGFEFTPIDRQIYYQLFYCAYQ